MGPPVLLAGPDRHGRSRFYCTSICQSICTAIHRHTCMHAYRYKCPLTSCLFGMQSKWRFHERAVRIFEVGQGCARCSTGGSAIPSPIQYRRVVEPRKYRPFQNCILKEKILACFWNAVSSNTHKCMGKIRGTTQY